MPFNALLTEMLTPWCENSVALSISEFHWGTLQFCQVKLKLDIAIVSHDPNRESSPCAQSQNGFPIYCVYCESVVAKRRVDKEQNRKVDFCP